MSRLILSFAVWSVRFTPSDMTEHLGVQPDKVETRGQDRVPSQANPKAHGWFLKYQDSTSNNLEEALKVLLERAMPISENLKLLILEDKLLVVNLNVSIRPFSYRLPFYFDNKTIALLHELRVNFDIDFFEPDDDVPQ